MVTTSPAASPDEPGAYRPAPAGERFVAGEVLAGRYRVVAPLGRGGMGEVYRADDLTLGQPVALKFLPPRFAADPEQLTRLRQEVAAARRVSHPHVCRVYDISDHAGQPFLTMEFIDGENLSSLLNRVGRLPEEKGTEVARQLCAALAAVHDQGLLHRDLKPANVMLDGRGRVRLTDFGLAAAAADVGAAAVRDGTPVYQAPEQAAGTEVTPRSDVFALGLVLFELFTGKRAFAGADRLTPPADPRTHVPTLGAEIGAAVLACLGVDPAVRPTAAAVLARLPGGDPLTAALAAGETPSPQVVADSGEGGLVRPATGVFLFALVLALLAGAFAVLPAASLRDGLPPLAPPAAQEQMARRLLDRLDVPPGRDAVGGYWYDPRPLRRLRGREPGADRFPHLAGGRTHVLTYYYRRSPEPLADRTNYGAAQSETPPRSLPGMAGVTLDGTGRLLEFYRVPDRELGLPATGAADTAALLDAAQLGDAAVTRAVPRWAPPVYADAHEAWDVAGRDGLSYHAEAASLRGRPVWFRLAHDSEGAEPAESPGAAVDVNGAALLFVLVALACGVPAARNLFRRRADFRGAGVLAGVVGGAIVVYGVAIARLLASPVTLKESATGIVGYAGVTAVMVGVCYLALEPVARRRWPWLLTAWSRLLAGRWRDPLVGRDALVGLAAGLAVLALDAAAVLVVVRGGGDRSELIVRPGEMPVDAGVVAVVATGGWVGIASGLTLVALFLILALVTRRPGLAWVCWCAVLVPVVFPRLFVGGLPPAVLIGYALIAAARLAVVAAVFARFGMLTACATSVAYYVVLLAEPTADPRAWYFGQGSCAGLVVVAAAGVAFWTATGGRRLFREGFYGDD